MKLVEQLTTCRHEAAHAVVLLEVGGSFERIDVANPGWGLAGVVLGGSVRQPKLKADEGLDRDFLHVRFDSAEIARIAVMASGRN